MDNYFSERSVATSVMNLTSEKFTVAGEIYSINKINTILWQDSDDVCDFWAYWKAK